jgi:transposase-like protein
MAPRITTETKQAIVALRVAGVPNVEVARRFHLHAVTVSRIFSKVRATVQRDAAREAEELAAYAKDLREKSYRALETGLKDRTNPAQHVCPFSWTRFHFLKCLLLRAWAPTSLSASGGGGW